VNELANLVKKTSRRKTAAGYNVDLLAGTKSPLGRTGVSNDNELREQSFEFDPSILWLTGRCKRIEVVGKYNLKLKAKLTVAANSIAVESIIVQSIKQISNLFKMLYCDRLHI
jgi:hypothetical protein